MELQRRIAMSTGRQKWLPARVRQSFIKRLCPQMFENHAFTTTMEGGLVFRGNVNNPIDKQIYFCGAHEKYLLHFLRDIVPVLRETRAGGLSFIDVGAQAGNHTLYMSRLVERIFAFEPSEAYRSQLENNIGLNALFNVRVYPHGLGKAIPRLPYAEAAAHAHPIGDQVVQQEQLGRIDILRADNAGHEKDVLLGLAATLKRDRPVMVIAVSAATRNHIISAGDFFQIFPDNYDFFYFARGDKESGRYQLDRFHYGIELEIEDVIALPKELRIQA